MVKHRVHIAGAGLVSALGAGLAEHLAALTAGANGLRPLTCFEPAAGSPLPVGEVEGLAGGTDALSRTHRLARVAADEAMAGCRVPPDAVVVGTTTGGMPTTEVLLKEGNKDSDRYRCHGVGTVGEDLARRFHCRGPVITVSTACASGAVAIAIAAAMLRAGLARRVLAGGADGLCRMTYYGFNALQLIDPQGARPMDANRRGMSVAEGAAMLLLTSDASEPPGVEILGAGLSCDAYHPTTPHPGGDGAMAAMQAALTDAGISIEAVDYINLHGTGTVDNDRAEAAAIGRLFAGVLPTVSSIKGATGHPLAAAGAIEAVVSLLCVENGLIPANIGCRQPDPDIGFTPQGRPERREVGLVMSNSFGFGGNNAALLVGRRDAPTAPASHDCCRLSEMPQLWISGSSCITGAGGLDDTLAAWDRGDDCLGMLDAARLSEGLPPTVVRRLKRLPRMALALAAAARRDAALAEMPGQVYFATGWGGQSETYDFLTRLFDTDERFPSPTDFINSVHNAPAGHVAQHLNATGANVTTSGGDTSFEQALLSAAVLSGAMDTPLLVMGADEYHPVFTGLLDPPAAAASRPADGGGALLLRRRPGGRDAGLRLLFFQREPADAAGIAVLVTALGGAAAIRARYTVLMAGIPGAARPRGDALLTRFLERSGFDGAVVDIRRVIGEFATATAAAAAMAAGMVTRDPAPGKGVLLIGFGEVLTALEVTPP
ncbi:MAG: beta-ketoacyl synthase N-terminal-like domain-containing protein [Pseudomonadota bacterium]